MFLENTTGHYWPVVTFIVESLNPENSQFLNDFPKSYKLHEMMAEVEPFVLQ